MLAMQLPSYVRTERNTNRRSWVAMLLKLLLLSAVSMPLQMRDPPPCRWQSHYSEAYKQARQEGKFLLIWFTNDQLTEAEQDFAKFLTENDGFSERMENFVPVRLAASASVDIDGQATRLLLDPSFGELHRQPGLAVIDLVEPRGPYYGYVVSLYPYRGGQPLDRERLKTFLDLPRGSLTQRTLIFAVRTHRDAPQSTRGLFDPLLAEESLKHSLHQASIRRQGHHNWDRRFQLISAKLPDRLHAQEVCAESWPGQGLIESAEECVRCWRQSQGHWSAVSAWQPRYGYDMKRGPNGIWYATGIFGRR
jgi:hypothetical protein